MKLEPPPDIEQTRGGFRQLYWNVDEGRYRAPVRFVLALTILLAALVGAGVVISLLEWFLQLPASVTTVLVEVGLLAWLVVVTLVVVRVVDRRFVCDVGLGVDSRWVREVAFGLGLGVLVAVVTVGGALVAGVATVDGILVTRDGDLLDGLPLVIGLLLSVVFFCLAGTLEELLFRGYLLVNTAEATSGLLGKRDAVQLAILVSAAVFGGVHALNPGASLLSTVVIFLFGVLLGASFAFTDRLAIPIGIHVAWNFTLGSLFGVSVSGLTTGSVLVAVEFEGPTLLTGGEFGPEGGLLALVALAVGATLLVLWLRHHADLEIKESVATPALRE